MSARYNQCLIVDVHADDVKTWPFSLMSLVGREILAVFRHQIVQRPDRAAIEQPDDAVIGDADDLVERGLGGQRRPPASSVNSWSSSAVRLPHSAIERRSGTSTPGSPPTVISAARCCDRRRRPRPPAEAKPLRTAGRIRQQCLGHTSPPCPGEALQTCAKPSLSCRRNTGSQVPFARPGNLTECPCPISALPSTRPC